MNQTITKEFLGNTFSYETEVNEEGQALWTEKIDSDFSKWIYGLRVQDRELFKVQYSLSQNAYDVVEKLKEKIGVYDDSLIVRAITITFIDFLDTRKGRPIMNKLNSYKESGDLEVLLGGDTLKKSLYFSPLGMRSVDAYSSLTGLKKSKVIKNAIFSVLLLSINEDEEIKEFWETMILQQITTMAKAA